VLPTRCDTCAEDPFGRLLYLRETPLAVSSLRSRRRAVTAPMTVLAPNGIPVPSAPIPMTARAGAAARCPGSC
jgi:hypothetical protein